MPRISVVIPVLNDADRLRLCLQRLAQQTLPQDQFEIIVVDNGSTDDLESVKADFSAIQFLTEDKRGPAAARNTGILQAGGEVIACTDADCLPADNWLEEGLKCLQGQSDHTLVAGRIEVVAKNPKASTSVELYDMHTWLQQEQNARNGFSASANLFFFKRLFLDVGMFDSDSFAFAGEDVDFCLRVQQRGMAVHYCSQAIVRHPAHESVRSKCQQEAAYQAAEPVLAAMWPQRKRSLPDFLPVQFCKKLFAIVVQWDMPWYKRPAVVALYIYLRILRSIRWWQQRL